MIFNIQNDLAQRITITKNKLYKQKTKKLKKSKTKNQTRQIKKNDHASTSSKTKK